ncbi:hypothetical protein MRX96_012794 [Rhipicephalus microplus]
MPAFFNAQVTGESRVSFPAAGRWSSVLYLIAFFPDLDPWNCAMRRIGHSQYWWLFVAATVCLHDFDDLSDEKTIQILAGHGSRASPFVSRGRAYLDKFQRILTDQEVPRRVESQIMRAEAWKGISSMAKLRRLHIVRMNSRNRYLRFGEAICKFIRKTTPLVVKKMATLKDDDRIVTAKQDHQHNWFHVVSTVNMPESLQAWK